MKCILLGIIGACLLLVVLAQLALPTLIGSLIARGIGEKLPAETLTAKVQKFPAVAMLDGKFSDITMSATNATVGKIIFRELTISLQDAALDMSALLRERRLALQSVRNVEMSGGIAQEELARYLKANVKGVKEAAVTVDHGKVSIEANLGFGGPLAFSVHLDGRVVGSGQQIKFVTDRFALNNTLAGNLAGSTFSEIQLVDLRNLPFAVGVREITMDKGKVTVYTDSHSLSSAQ